MAQTLLYRWFGIGALPGRMRPQLEAEGIRLIEEGIGMRFTLRNFRAPGRYHGWKRGWGSGSVVLTKRRILATLYWREVIDIPLDHPYLHRVDWSLDEQGRLLARFEANDFIENQRGELELRLSCEHAGRLLAELR